MSDQWLVPPDQAVIIPVPELYYDAQSMGDAEHIARHDPAHVLADVDAKRQVIAEHYCPDDLDIDEKPHCGFCDKALVMNDRQGEWPCRHLRLLALPYADHPDYRAEWRPNDGR